MTLSFSTKWDKRMGDLAGKETLFTDKTYMSLWKHYYEEYSDFVQNMSKSDMDIFYEVKPFKDGLSLAEIIALKPKHHTIREDKSDRWHAGRDIHFVINNRTKSRFQFAPVIKCVSVQRIEIEYSTQIPILVIDNRHFFNPFLGIDEGMEELAINDGFPNIDAFFQYFNYDFKGKIIHWTDLKY